MASLLGKPGNTSTTSQHLNSSNMLILQVVKHLIKFGVESMMLAATCYHTAPETAINRLTSCQNRLASHEYKKPISEYPFERNVA